MRFIDHFLDTQQGQLAKTTYIINEKDRTLITRVFPDLGFKTFFPGFAMRVIADGLREAQIKTLHDRIVSATFSNIPDLTARLEDAWRKELRK